MKRFLRWWFRKSIKAKAVHPDSCLHLSWEPESKANGWRESCRTCGIKAYGSCQ